MRLFTFLSAVAIPLSCAALSVGFGCAAGNPSTFDDADAAPPEPEGGRRSTTTFAEAGTYKPHDPRAECAQDTKQIYVVATDKTLYRFYPDMLKFVRIGAVKCPTTAGTFSMAIDKYGIAWIEYTDGRLYAVDTADGTCQATPFAPGQNGFTNFGMGYAKNGDNASGETLYVAGAGLAALDTNTFQLNFLGSLSFGRTELTGLDTQLFAYSVTSGVIVSLDKSTGATKSVMRTSAIDEMAAFAFAQWGGAFWVFTGNDQTTVTKYDPATDVSTEVMKNTGLLVDGAGSSTCAPTTAPR